MATKSALDAVHDAMADWAIEALTAKDEDGKRLLTAAEAGVIRAFLKDNEITAPVVAGTKLYDLQQKLLASKLPAGTPVDPFQDLGQDFPQ